MNVAHYYCTETNLGNTGRAVDLLDMYVKENNEMNDKMMNMQFTVWVGKTVFKRNTADDQDKKFYSYSLQVNIIL